MRDTSAAWKEREGVKPPARSFKAPASRDFRMELHTTIPLKELARLVLDRRGFLTIFLTSVRLLEFSHDP